MILSHACIIKMPLIFLEENKPDICRRFATLYMSIHVGVQLRCEVVEMGNGTRILGSMDFFRQGNFFRKICTVAQMATA